MKKICTTTTLLFLFTVCAYSQWNATPSPAVLYRYDDVYFLNPSTGWAVNFASNTTDGMVIKTVDSGQSWQTVLSSSGAAFRDIGFTDPLHGWIGTLENGQNSQDTVIMYQTIDGGTNWTQVQNFPGPRPAGICGMCVINDSTVYACGRYPGPAGFYKTTNNGLSWSYTNMSAYAGGLVDIHFTNPDSGFVVGTSGAWNLGRGRIVFTADGGNTWQIKHTSAHQGELCWKISFPSANIGYVSLESFRGTSPQYFLKTTDGGMTWQDLSFPAAGLFDAEGMGFINDTTGWIGGGTFTYKTTDGGLTWNMDPWGSTVNRFRFFGDTLGYAGGEKIYKFQRGSLSVLENNSLHNVQVFPNPFVSAISIVLQKPGLNQGTSVIRNILGQAVFTDLENKPVNADAKTIDLSFLTSGIYFLDMTVNGERMVKKIVKE